MQSSKILLIVLINCTVWKLCASQHYLGDKCKVNDTEDPGICRFVEDCPDIVKIFKENKTFPTLCGFQSNKEIFCCPVEIITKLSFDTSIINHESVKSKILN